MIGRSSRGDSAITLSVMVRLRAIIMVVVVVVVVMVVMVVVVVVVVMVVELGLSIWDFAAGTLLVQEAGGVVSDLGGGSRHFETGNVIAGNIRLHRELVATIRPHLPETLRA